MQGVVDVWFELLSVEPCAVGAFEVFHRATGGRYCEFGMCSGYVAILCKNSAIMTSPSDDNAVCQPQSDMMFRANEMSG